MQTPTYLPRRLERLHFFACDLCREFCSLLFGLKPVYLRLPQPHQVALDRFSLHHYLPQVIEYPRDQELDQSKLTGNPGRVSREDISTLVLNSPLR